MTTVAEDRAWVASEYNILFARQPTEYELNHVVEALQSGRYTRARWAQEAESLEPEAAVKRIWAQYYSTTPSAEGIKYYADRLRAGVTTRADIEAEIAKAPGAGVGKKEAGDAADKAAGNEDARSVIDGVLDQYQLPGLKDWAWQQIQSGHSLTRIEQDLRNTPEYQARFKGLIDRQKLGLPPKTEIQWMNYEDDIRSEMRSFGLPPTFYDNLDDFARLGAADLSIEEIRTRIEQGWNKVENASPEVKQAFANMFGISGSNNLAAFMLDTKHALPILDQMVGSAENQGFGSRFGFNLRGFGGAGLTGDLVGTGRAGELAQLGIRGEQAMAGLAKLAELKPVFQETVSEGTNLVAEQQGLDAIFGLGDSSILQRRLAERHASTAGGGGSIIGQSGVGAGAAN